MIDPSGFRRAPAGGWTIATVVETVPSAGGVRLRLDVADRLDHLPGQHYVVRLTAPDGYVAQRSYSVASAPADPLIELFVERLEDGEVSPYLADVVEAGDRLDVRGPIGGWFVWTADTPAVGLAGGSGVVPLIAMVRHAADVGREGQLRLAVSARTLAVLPYAAELAERGALLALTREVSPQGRPAGRLTLEEVRPLLAGLPAPDAGAAPCFVCGSAAFAEGATTLLVDAGVEAGRIRVERFGPSG